MTTEALKDDESPF